MNQQIRDYILKNPRYRTGYYQEVATKFGVSYEVVRHIARKIRKEKPALSLNCEAIIGDAKKENQETLRISRKDYHEFLKFKARKSLPLIKVTKSLPKPYLKGNPKNTLIISDTHEPFSLEDSLEFCRDIQEKYDCGTVVHIGDIVDNHAVSYHESDPSGRSAGDEFELAITKCKQWYEVFPEVKICIGNHDALPFRKAFSAGLPEKWLKTYQDLLESPQGWKWDFTHIINGVIYTHGTGMSGEMAAINAARENRQSTVIGHLHTICNTKFMASYKDLIFGMTVGCLIDFKQYAFAYGKMQTKKPVVAIGVVLDGTLPINIPMILK